MRRAILTTLTFTCLCAACGGDSATSPTTPTTPTRSTENFSGTLPILGSQFYSFTVTTSGTTDVTLLSLRPAGSVAPALTSEVALGLGTPAGTGCALSATAIVRPALTTELSTATAATIYCVNISDVGNLADPAAFAIRIVHP